MPIQIAKPLLDITGLSFSLNFIAIKLNVYELTQSEGFTAYTAIVSAVWLTSKAIESIRNHTNKKRKAE